MYTGKDLVSSFFVVGLLEEKTIVFVGSTCTEYIGFVYYSVLAILSQYLSS